MSHDPSAGPPTGPGTAAPAIAPGALADVLEAAPGRVRQRLEREATAASAWSWVCEGEEWTVQAGDETVRISPAGAVVASVAELTCTCLLSPRCFHVVAVANLLPVATDEVDHADAEQADMEQAGTEETGPENTGPTASDGTDASIILTAPQQVAVARTWEAASAALAGGATAAGPLVRAQLLRAAHACQDQSLPRLAAAATRVATGARDLAADEPSFVLDTYAADLADCLGVAWRLRAVRTTVGGAGIAASSSRDPGDTDDPGRADHPDGAAVSRVDVGTSRRAYEPIDDRQLRGLCTEPVATASGYAGVVTHLVDDRGEVWTVSDVAPGEPGRATTAYRTPARLGDVAVQHAQLGRTRAFGQGLTASADHRLGSGASVRATRAGDSSWDDPALAGLWREPWRAQLDRALAALDEPAGARPSGDTLLFLQAVIGGTVGDGLDLEVLDDTRVGQAAVRVRGLAPVGTPGTLGVRNLRVLARLVGARFRVVARPSETQPRTVHVLAIDAGVAPAGPGDGERGDEGSGDGVPALRLPIAWHGRANLGLDRIERSHASHVGTLRRAGLSVPDDDDDPDDLPDDPPADGPAPVERWSVGDDPVEPLARILCRTALGGRTTMTSGGTSVARAATALRASQLVTAARILEHLEAAALETRRSITGERYAPPPDELARRWSAAMTYTRAVRRHQHRAAWD
jgi:hypothetical protein